MASYVVRIEKDKPTKGKQTIYMSDGVVLVTDMEPTGEKKETGVLTGILAAIPGILSTLFPSGIGGSGNTPVIYTNPTTGNQEVSGLGGNNSILILLLVAMGAYILFTGQKPIKGKR